MVTISPKLRDIIERRSRRAWRRLASGSSRKNHRISDITDDALMYRVPDSPDYYGKEKVQVVRKDDGTVVVDPPTTGLIDILKRDDLKRINKHAGEIKAYITVKKNAAIATAGYQVGSQYQVKSHEQALELVKDKDDVIVVVKAHADDVNGVHLHHVTLDSLKVDKVIDSVKDLGYTVGLIDCRTKADVVKLRDLKKHLGKIRAYKYTTKNAESPVHAPKLKYKVGEKYEIKDANTNPGSNCHAGINVAHSEWCKGKPRVFAFEFKLEDIAAIPTNTDGKFRLHRCLCVEEIDPKTLKPIPQPEPTPPPLNIDPRPNERPKADMGGIGDAPKPGKKKKEDAGGGTPASESPPKQEKPKGFFGKLFGKKDEEDETE